jgi:hypothetical protein
MLRRIQEGRVPNPSLLYVDNQLVKAAEMISQELGIDCNKKVSRRKR